MSCLIVEFPERRRLADKSTPSASPRARSVRFSGRSNVVLFERYGESNASSLWYSEADTNDMKLQRNRHIVETSKRLPCILSVEDGSTSRDVTEELDIFGIENLMTKKLIKRTMANRKRVVDAVLDEQARQNYMNECCPERISEVSQKHTRWSSWRAGAIGELHSRASDEIICF